MKVVVGSESRIKLSAVAAALESLGITDAVCSGVTVESGVGIQPVGTGQIEDGARTRARNASILCPGADFYIGIENGIVFKTSERFDVPCVVVRDDAGRESMALGAFFPIPIWMADRTLDRQSELGEIVKELAGGGEKDPMAYLSRGTLAREALLAQAVCCALVPLLNQDRYQAS